MNVSPVGIFKKIFKKYFPFGLISFCNEKPGFRHFSTVARGSGSEHLSPISTIDLDTYLTLLPTVKNQAKLTNRNKATDFLKNGKNTLHRYITGAVL
jgi:hypothetical protein